MRKLSNLINLMILIKLPMYPCLHPLLLILRSSNYISMGIFAMSSSLALSPTISASYVISLFYNKDFFVSHPDIVVQKKSDSPDEDKCVHDPKLLILTLKDFFFKHPLINLKAFLGNAAFDTVELYKSLLSDDTFGDDKHFSKAYIPLNTRSGLENQDYTINENSIPFCPHDSSLP